MLFYNNLVISLDCCIKSHVYLVKDGENSYTMIDAGVPFIYDEILKELEKINIKPEWVKRIFLTHSDVDHIGACKDFFQNFKTRIFISREEAEVFMKKSFHHTLNFWAPNRDNAEIIYNTIDVKDLEFYPANGTIGDYKIIKVPGHSAGSVIIEYKGVCFVGDLLMVKNNEFIPVDEDYNENQTTYIKTLQKANLGKTQFIFPGHGKPIPTQPAWNNFTKTLKNIEYVVTDANTIVGEVAYKFNDICFIYPITPSTQMAEYGESLSQKNKLNLFGNITKYVEMQSEGGVAGALHGALATSTRAATFTSSQGLLLMIPNMYKIAGELLPTVIHVASRSLATHALNIYGDHQDVMSVRQTGWGIICANNVQEAQDLAVISYVLAYTLKSIPFIHFFDGFWTSHEINKIKKISDQQMHELYDCHEPSFTNEGLGSQNLPCQTGTNQNSDAYFQNTEVRNPVYEKSLKQIKSVLQKFNKLVGRKYGIFDYVGVKNPNLVFVIMGSGADTVEETVKLLNTTYKQKVGVIKVRFYRPFFSEEFVKTIPVSTKKIIVLDRTKEFGADGEPLFKDVVFAISQYCDKKIKVCGGRYGLGGKNFDVQDTLDIYENMVSAKPVNNFSIGIVDDVNHTSIPKAKKYLALSDEGVRVYGLGSDGTLSACKIIVNIAGTTTNKFVQAFFEYDSKKSGSLTVSHLRFSPSPITQHFYVKNPSVVQINNFRYVFLPNVLNGIKEEGTVILNTSFNKELLNLHLPEEFKKVVITKKLKLYTINAFEVANRNKLDKKINIIMMACFLKITNYIDYLDASRSIIEKIKTTFFSKGEEVIQNNIKAFQESTESLTFVDYREFVGHKTKKQTKQEAGISNKYYAFLQKFVNKQGDELPVSAFKNSLDGKVFPTNFFPETKSSFEQLPIWKSEECIQCGKCVLSCPHAALQSFLIENKKLDNAPTSLKTRTAFGVENTSYAVQVNPLACTGCGVCKNACIAKNNAFKMENFEENKEQQSNNFNWLLKNDVSLAKNKFSINTPKGIQFKESMFKNTTACAGCGETPYINLLTRMFGSELVIANATGCSSIYSASYPYNPFWVNNPNNSRTPSWSNSLFEDNAEYGYGMEVSLKTKQNNILEQLKSLSDLDVNTIIQHYKETNHPLETKIAVDVMTKKLEKYKNSLLPEFNSSKKKIKYEPKNDFAANFFANRDVLLKKTVWLIGGDGWAYDIDYGGIDHILAQNERVRILVLDNELYANTGGQCSKATPRGAVAKLASGGKNTKKKNLGILAMMGKNAYVAQVSLGADLQQTMLAFKEAEEFAGPAIIIAYCPCIAHGVDMAKTNNIQAEAVNTGYWDLYRFNPHLQSPLSLDRVNSSIDYTNFIDEENRFKLLNRINKNAKTIIEQSIDDATERKKILEDLEKVKKE